MTRLRQRHAPYNKTSLPGFLGISSLNAAVLDQFARQINVFDSAIEYLRVTSGKAGATRRGGVGDGWDVGAAMARRA